MKSLANDLVNISQIKWHIAAKFELQWKRFSNKHHLEFIIFNCVSLNLRFLWFLLNLLIFGRIGDRPIWLAKTKSDS